MQSALDSFVFDKVVLAIGKTLRVDPSGLSRSTRLADDLQTLGDIVSYFSFRYFRDVEIAPLSATA